MVYIQFNSKGIHIKFNVDNNPTSDARYQYFKLLNVLNYCYINKYDLIFGTKQFVKYRPLLRANSKFINYMITPHWQKAYFIRHALSKLNYKWIFDN